MSKHVVSSSTRLAPASMARSSVHVRYCPLLETMSSRTAPAPPRLMGSPREDHINALPVPGARVRMLALDEQEMELLMALCLASNVSLGKPEERLLGKLGTFWRSFHRGAPADG